MKTRNVPAHPASSRLATLLGQLGLAAGLMMSVSAAEASDLLQIYQEAAAHDARYAAAKAEYSAGKEKVVQGRARLLPTITGSADYYKNNSENQMKDLAISKTTDKFTSSSYGATLSQPLFRAQNWQEYKIGQLQTALSASAYGQASQALILRAAEAYFNVLIAQDSVNAISQLRTAAAEQLQLAKTSFNVGTVTVTDVHEAQSRYDLATAQEIAARNKLNVANESLARVIGHTPDELAGLKEGVEISAPNPTNLSSWVSAAEKGDYGVQAQTYAREIAVRELSHARAGHLPTLDLGASYRKSRTPSGDGDTPGGYIDRNTDRRVGVELNLPIFEGGAIHSRTREAAALKIKADADLEDARRAAALSAREAYLGVTSGIAQVKALEAARVSSASALESNRLGYQVGVRINIDVLNAQSQLADTVQQLSKARYDTLLAQLRLKAAIGTLGEADVRVINALLETRSNANPRFVTTPASELKPVRPTRQPQRQRH